jgi:hypothetical protein
MCGIKQLSFHLYNNIGVPQYLKESVLGSLKIPKYTDVQVFYIKWYITYECLSVYFLFFQYWELNAGLILPRQALYHLSHASNAFCFFYFISFIHMCI